MLVRALLNPNINCQLPKEKSFKWNLKCKWKETKWNNKVIGEIQFRNLVQYVRMPAAVQYFVSFIFFFARFFFKLERKIPS